MEDTKLNDSLNHITTSYDPASGADASALVFRKGDAVKGVLYGEAADYVMSLIAARPKAPPHDHRPDFKFGRARATLTSVMPYCHDRQKAITALCEICGTLKAFTYGTINGSHSEFPKSGLWTECRACQSWTMFYRVHDGHIQREHVGKGPGL